MYVSCVCTSIPLNLGKGRERGVGGTDVYRGGREAWIRDVMMSGLGYGSSNRAHATCAVDCVAQYGDSRRGWIVYGGT